MSDTEQVEAMDELITTQAERISDLEWANREWYKRITELERELAVANKRARDAEAKVQKMRDALAFVEAKALLITSRIGYGALNAAAMHAQDIRVKVAALAGDEGDSEIKGRS